MYRRPSDYSLEILENDPWPDQESYTTPLEQQVHALRKFPIGELSPAELRLIIGQQMGLTFLVPLALDMLQHDPLMEASFYDGDLLMAVIGVNASFWPAHAPLQERVKTLIENFAEDIAQSDLSREQKRNILDFR